MRNIWKKAVVLAAMVVALGMPVASVQAADLDQVHTTVSTRGKDDKLKITYKLSLDKTKATDGRLVVVYDPEVLVLQKATEGYRFAERDMNTDYTDEDGKGFSYAFINDEPKDVKGTLFTLEFTVKPGLEAQETSIQTKLLALNNEEEEVIDQAVLEDQISVGKQKPAKPVIKTIEQTLLGVEVFWDADKNVDGYIVYRSTSANAKYTEEAIVLGDSYWDVFVNNNTTYFYKIQAFKGKGSQRVYSEMSDAVSVKVRKFSLFGWF